MKVLHNEKGLSLVEVVASLFIFSIALLFLSNFLVRSFEISGNQDNRQVAMNLARQTVEEWESGNGWIPSSNEQKEIAERYKSDTPLYLSYSLLSELIPSVPKGNEKDPRGIKLSPITINERTYNTFVDLGSVGTPNPLIRIEVKVFANDVELARLETLMPNPDIGQEIGP